MKILHTYKIAASVALACMSSVSFAQSPNITDQAQTQMSAADAVNTAWKPSLVKDGVYDQAPHISNPIMWQPIREADVMYKKRVWREIDIREKQNQAFRYPGDENTGGGYFIEILLDAVKKGKIKAYSTFDDRFTTAMSKQEVMDQLTGKDDSTLVTDVVTGAQTVQITHKDFNPDLIIKYRIKEDWIFDRNQGRMVVRIIGIAPIVAKIDPTTGEPRGQSPLFWIYYPEARQALAQYEVFNPDNDVQRLTWDDFFENRFFSSYIIKASNGFDEYISNQYPGMESLYEAQRINDQIFNKEHDMWVY
ncbi:type IX secretion system ring subunit PorN/GldN [Taibaiella soli]|uniref:Gliding motility protein GldN n=1 Tax=Taibaiella soli TaxID=1649169 RepID=A0A2W2AZ48_9BACT|nr:gliding motility protein GldN [Taibaiella soli]PZF73294.1 gliding motility protein GldN [Taibaiella soli]